MTRLAVSALLLVVSGTTLGHAGGPSPNSPPDKPLSVHGAEQQKRLIEVVQPLVEEAKKTYPSAKTRFLAGLPRGYTFSVVTRLYDSSGKMEQVFVGVRKIKHGVISGEIWSDIDVVSGYHANDKIRVPEDEIVDWVITAPDGTEEGNVLGKWLDDHRGPF